jgi:hypothetical protein
MKITDETTEMKIDDRSQSIRSSATRKQTARARQKSLDTRCQRSAEHGEGGIVT